MDNFLNRMLLENMRELQRLTDDARELQTLGVTSELLPLARMKIVAHQHAQTVGHRLLQLKIIWDKAKEQTRGTSTRQSSS